MRFFGCWLFDVRCWMFPVFFWRKQPQPSLKKRMNRSEEHTSELQSRQYLVCRLLLEKKRTRTPKQTGDLPKPPALHLLRSTMGHAVTTIQAGRSPRVYLVSAT